MTNSADMRGTQGAAFGLWLKERRNVLGLTREELADKLSCSPDTIYKVEVGARRPSRQVAEILADFFSVPDDEREAFVSFARGQGHERERGALEGEEASASRERPWRAAQRKVNNLPAQVTSLIGREQEVEQVRTLLLRDRVRLLTLIGPPGIGKTRLAVAVAAGMLSSPQGTLCFEDGVFFVPLATVTDPNLVIATIAKTLNVKEAAAGLRFAPSSLMPILETLAHHLSDKRLLLVLDNFEQIVGAGPQVAQLLTECPWLKVLVTSREALRLYGERQYPVPPLDVPGSRYDVLGRSEELGAYAAVELFVERAQAVRPDFTLNGENAEGVARICGHLEGLPLAIELAAARVRLLSPQAMLPMLQQSLQLLTGGARDLPPRHQTLRGAIQWSYNLLEEEEQQLFRRLGVFVGGCALAAIEAVCNPQGEMPGGAARIVESLLDKSLLRQSEEAGALSVGDHRFSMLETVREYALEQLEMANSDETRGTRSPGGEAAAVRRLHAEYYLALAEALGLAPSRRSEWIGHLAREHDNLLAALHWAREHGEIEMALRMSAALHDFWFHTGYISEGRAESEATLALSERLDTAARARLLSMAGRLAWMQQDYAAERRFCQQSLAIAQKLGHDVADKRARAEALRGVMNVANREGNYTLARQYAEERLALYKELEDAPGTVAALYDLGNVGLNIGDYERARRFYEESLEMGRKLGDESKQGPTYINLGEAARAQDDYVAARVFYEKALAIFRKMGSRTGIAMALSNLGQVSAHDGRYAQALVYLKESLGLYEETGQAGSIGRCLAGISAAWSGQGYAEKAARLLGAAESLMSSVDYRLVLSDQHQHERNLAIMRDMLGEEAFETVRKEGATMSMEEAIVYALEIGEP